MFSEKCLNVPKCTKNGMQDTKSHINGNEKPSYPLCANLLLVFYIKDFFIKGCDKALGDHW